MVTAKRARCTNSEAGGDAQGTTAIGPVQAGNLLWGAETVSTASD